VPVTAKLSRQFYDKLGDEVANELVEWFNQVDAQYKSELKDLFEVYYGCFRAELRSEMAALRAELIKWMFIFWVGSVATMIGLLFAAVTLTRR